MNKIYYLNKKNIIMILTIIIIIGVLGLLFFIRPDTFVSSFIRSRTFIKYTGLLIIISFIPFLIAHLLLLKDSYGLKITEQGFVNNTNLTNVGMINWKDILRIEKRVLKRNSMILIFLKNEENYYSQIKNPLKKLTVLLYRHTYGASFVIEPKNLKGYLDEIESTLQDYIKVK